MTIIRFLSRSDWVSHIVSTSILCATRKASTFSRTFLLMKDFARVLSLADQVVLAPIMGSREINTFGVTAEQLRDCIPGAVLCSGFDGIAETALSFAGEGDLILT